MPKSKSAISLAPDERILSRILVIRGHKVILDADLAELYGVQTKVFLQAVKRNRARFPQDFMFQLTREEFKNLRSQIVTSSQWGGRRYAPHAFTEHGVAMLSSVLKSRRAIQINIEIMRAFVRLRKLISANRTLAQKVEELERKVATHEEDILDIFTTILELAPLRQTLPPKQPEPETETEIGFLKDRKGKTS
jgi:aromatic ring-opening dioxygenase LigB subunit